MKVMKKIEIVMQIFSLCHYEEDVVTFIDDVELLVIVGVLVQAENNHINNNDLTSFLYRF